VRKRTSPGRSVFNRYEHMTPLLPTNDSQNPNQTSLYREASFNVGILFCHWSVVATESREILKQCECELK